MEDKKKLARRIDKLCSPLMLKFFFCYSDEMKEDVDKAELELRRMETYIRVMLQ